MAIVHVRVRHDAVLELLGVERIGLVEVGPGHEGRALHLALRHVLKAGGHVVVVAGVLLALRGVGEHAARQPEFVRHDSMNCLTLSSEKEKYINQINYR